MKKCSLVKINRDFLHKGRIIYTNFFDLSQYWKFLDFFREKWNIFDFSIYLSTNAKDNVHSVWSPTPERLC